MAIKNKLIPFSWLPASWGLSGQPFDEAKAYYELDGEELDRRLADIRISDPAERHRKHLSISYMHGRIAEYEYETQIAESSFSGAALERAKLAIDLKHSKIDPYVHDCKIAVLDFPDNESLEQQTALLTADFKHGKIEKLEFEKTLATAKNEPWVGVVEDGFNPDDGVNGFYFSLDWNDQWVEYLRKNGYHGYSDDQIVEQWFSDVCRSQAEANPPPDLEPAPFNSGRIINRVRRDTGGTEYS